MGRDIGAEGEHYFGVLCNSAGLTANRSLDKDRYGWDYFVEFPNAVESNNIDSSPSPIECKVQIKSTLKREGKLQVKISVLHRLVTAHYPAFFVFIEFGCAQQPENVYVVHVGEAIIGRVLARIRKLEAEGRGNLLHKSKITIKYNNEDRLSVISGESLKEKIESFVLNGMNGYTKDKLKTLEVLGYPESPHTLKVTLYSEQGTIVEDVTKMHLGLSEDGIKAKLVSAYTTRFDIQLPHKQLSGIEDGMLFIKNNRPSLTGTLFFKEHKYCPVIEFDAGLYLLPSIWSKEEKISTFRVVAKDFEIVSINGESSMKIIGTPEDEKKIADLRKYFWLLNMINSGATLCMGFEKDGNAIEIGDISFKENLEEKNYYFEALSIIDKAISICQTTMVPMDRVIVSWNILEHFKGSIHKLHSFLNICAGELGVYYDLEECVSENDHINISIVGLGKTRIGNACFAYAWAMIFYNGKKTFKDEKIHIMADDKMISDIKFGSVEEISNIDMVSIREKLINKLKGDGLKVHYFD